MRAELLSRLRDVQTAIVTFPSAQTWRRCLLVYLIFIACAFPLGLASGFLQPRLASLTPTMFALLPIYLFLRPALLEELVFRAVLLPRDPSRIGRRRLLGTSALALAAFVVSHPLNAWLTRPAAFGLFTDPAFLTCAALLGIACTVAYLISRSLWPPVLLHWITVIVWIMLLGGQGLIGTRLDEQRSTRVVATERELAADVEQFAEGLAQSGQFTGVVLLSRNSQPLVRRTFGFADRTTQREITVDTPFALASVSKMFTAVVVAQLVEQKEISFDTTIASVLPAYPAGQSQVTVRQLLTMSSGIPDIFKSPQFWVEVEGIRKPADFWRFFANAPLEFTPGSKWAYSNSNFLILGAIVERIKGQPFATTVEQQVFLPAGMGRTSYRSRLFPDAAMGYTHTRPGSEPGGPSDPDHWYPAWEAKVGVDGDDTSDFVVGAPMGGGVSTAGDLTRFAEALMSGKLLSQEMTRRVLTAESELADYGGNDSYGFETLNLNGVRIVGHRGGFTGVSNQVEFYPDHGYVLAILGNSDSDGTERIVKRVRSMIADSRRGL